MPDSTVQAVFGTYTRQALDAEYDNVRKIRGFDFQKYLAELDAANASARKVYEKNLHADLRYGPGQEEILDLFVVNPGGPLHVFFHGGYWRLLHKNDFTYIAHGVLPHGHNLAVVNYTLIPNTRMGDLVAECVRAVNWLMDNADRYGFDPTHVSVFGHSAGGHLAAMMALKQFACPLRSVSALSGIFDLRPIQKCFLNDVLALTDEEVERFSPVRHQPIHTGTIRVITGAREGAEYERQAKDLVHAWAARGAKMELTVADGHDHFSLRAALADPESEITKLSLCL